jgi:hypothetical protein
MSNAQIWIAMLILFLLAESAIVTWGNVERAKALAEAARPRLAAGDEGAGAGTR